MACRGGGKGVSFTIDSMVLLSLLQHPPLCPLKPQGFVFTDATFKPDKNRESTMPTQLWCKHRAATEAKYGHISTWCVAASGGGAEGSGRRRGGGAQLLDFG